MARTIEIGWNIFKWTGEKKGENGAPFKVNGQRLKPYLAGKKVPKGVIYSLGNTMES